MTGKFYSHGKLLITGEYVVLDGALALAVPTKFGQSLEAESSTENNIRWTALDHEGKQWFQTSIKFDGSRFVIEADSSTSGEPEERLAEILTQAHKLNPAFLNPNTGYNIITRLDFPQDWGLGSSSTLINNVAQWFGIDPFVLLNNTFGGSGYDIAAAQNEHPISFQLTKGKPAVLIAAFNPEFAEELFFVHLNRKQDSRASISHYKAHSAETLNDTVSRISALTQRCISCTTLEEFKLLMEIHETLISKLINIPKIKTNLFPDFPGSIKSLGGWGGDFILATGGEQEKDYFRKKGYKTILSYEEMVK